MREAMGGALTFEALLVFLLLVMGILFFSVSYTRAFRFKNQVIDVIEEFEGLTEDAEDKIDRIAKNQEYTLDSTSPYARKCESRGYQALVRNGDPQYVLCVSCELVDVTGREVSSARYKGARFRVASFVNVNIPVIKQIFPATADFLMVEGETDLILSSGNNSELCRNIN